MDSQNLKILYLTQKVDKDDNILFPFYKWLNLIAAKTAKVHVICLKEGRHEDLAGNITVHSLGKEKGEGRQGYLRNFYATAWRLFKNKEVDVIFCHMAEINVLLIWPLAILFGKPICWWKAHGHLSWKSKLAVLAVTRIFTSSESGFPVITKKKQITGQGVDTDYFSLKTFYSEQVSKIIWAGRISAIKNIETLILAADFLINQKKLALQFMIYGNPIMPADQAYQEKLRALISAKNLNSRVIFGGEIAHEQLAALYRSADIFVNTSNTGSLDKTVLEAMACGTIVVNSNYGYSEILRDFPWCFFKQGNAQELSANLLKIASLSKEARAALGRDLREVVVRDQNITALSDKFLKTFEQVNQ